MIEQVKKFIQNELIKDGSGSNLKESDNLIESGIIDSLGIQQLIMFIENQFKIDILDDDLVPDNFETINNIEIFISTKK